MPGVKGVTNNPNGRPKGSQNKDVKLAREAIAKFVDENTERLQGWLDQIAEESPEKAFNCVKDLIEYHVPKLARTELTGKDGEDIKTVNRIEIVPYEGKDNTAT